MRRYWKIQGDDNEYAAKYSLSCTMNEIMIHVIYTRKAICTSKEYNYIIYLNNQYKIDRRKVLMFQNITSIRKTGKQSLWGNHGPLVRPIAQSG